MIEYEPQPPPDEPPDPEVERLLAFVMARYAHIWRVKRRFWDSCQRNDPCRCGSGLKHKKCCLPKLPQAWRHLAMLNSLPKPEQTLGPSFRKPPRLAAMATIAATLSVSVGR